MSNHRTKVAAGNGLHLWTRPALLDETVIAEVIGHNVYGLSAAEMRGSTVVDLGAHVGVFSVFAASLGAARVIAVEPQPENLELLRMNTADWPAVEVYECAMGASEEPRWIGGESGGAHTIPLSPGETPFEGVQVPTITLEGLLTEADVPSVRLLKLDMEGGEVDTLLACSHDRLATIQRITLETHGPLICPWVGKPRVGELLEHLLYTHNIIHASGYPTRLGLVSAARNGVNGGWND